MATAEDVRRIALTLPEVIEKPWFNTPGFRVKDKGFLRIRTEAKGGLVVFVFVSDLVNLPAIDVGELIELITDYRRLKAPKRVLQANEHLLPRATEP